MQSVKQHLLTCKTLRALSPSHVSMLATDCELLNADRGTTLYHETDIAIHIYLLVFGRVQISHVDEVGHRSILNWVSPKQLFGEYAVCHCSAREEQADMVERSQVIRIPAESLKSLIHKCPEICLELLSLLGSRRQNFERRIKSLMFRSTGNRLASLLLELADSEGNLGNREIRIPRISHQDLAGMIGVARETVTIILGQLRADGLIQIDNREIVIRQRDRLAELTTRSTRKSTTTNS